MRSPFIGRAVVDFRFALFGSNIKPSREGSARTRKDYYLHVRVILDHLKNVSQLRHQFLTERVQFVRAIQGEIADPAFLGKKKTRVIHRLLLRAISSRNGE